MGREYKSRQAGIEFYHGYVRSLNFKKYSLSIQDTVKHDILAAGKYSELVAL